MRRSFSLLWFVWLLFVWQGCTPLVRNNVTITLKNGQHVPLCLEYLYGQDTTQPFREFLEKLEAGEEVDVNKSLEESFTYTPLMYAITHALDTYDNDPYFYAARYLLEHDADPNLLSSPPTIGASKRQLRTICVVHFGAKEKLVLEGWRYSYRMALG